MKPTASLGQRWVGQLADDLFIVHAEHRGLIGDGYFGALAGIDQLQAAKVVARHDACGLWQSFDPLGDVFHFDFPRLGGLVLAGPASPPGLRGCVVILKRSAVEPACLES